VTTSMIWKLRRGAAMLTAVALLAVIMLIGAGLLQHVVTQQRAATAHAQRLQANYLAESALDLAATQVLSDEDYTGETWQPTWKSGTTEQSAEVKIAVSRDDQQQTAEISVTAIYPVKSPSQSQASLHRTISLAKGS
jgi:type II secretory pathway component PulK